MAIYEGTNKPTMTAEQIINLKKAVKAEMLRRKYTGSVSSYGGTDYDFKITPETGKAMLATQGDKIITPLLAIKDIEGLETPVTGEAIPEAFDYNNLNTIVANLAKEPIYGNSSSCKASCTGLCQGGCANTCSGCTGCGGCGGCTGSCTGCSKTCSGGCTGCGDACSSDCSGACYGGCYGCSACSMACQGCTNQCSGCVGGCFTTCTGCGNGCEGNCSGTCTGVCSGCSGSCYGRAV